MYGFNIYDLFVDKVVNWRDLPNSPRSPHYFCNISFILLYLNLLAATDNNDKISVVAMLHWNVSKSIYLLTLYLYLFSLFSILDRKICWLVKWKLRLSQKIFAAKVYRISQFLFFFIFSSLVEVSRKRHRSLKMWSQRCSCSNAGPWIVENIFGGVVVELDTFLLLLNSMNKKLFLFLIFFLYFNIYCLFSPFFLFLFLVLLFTLRIN